MNISRLLAVVTLMSFVARGAVTVSPQEMAQKNAWVQRNLLTATNLPPFSFNYHGLSSSSLLPNWVRTQSDTVIDANRTQHTLSWTNAGIPIQLQCVAVEYGDFPVVEWTVYFKNIGLSNSAMLQNIEGLDTTFSRTNGPEFVLNGNQGDFATADSYEPLQFTLGPNVVKNFAPPETGKSSEGPNGWPYWDLQIPGGGVILAVGWPGQWASSFIRDAGTNLRIWAGQELTSLYLAPGEQIRTPLIALLFWQGTDVVRAQNLWRHWYLAHNMPRVNGQLPSPLLQIQVSGDDTNAVLSFLHAGIVPDLCWRDAGGSYSWYPSAKGPYSGGDAWLNTGTWEVDTTKYPAGFKPFTDWIHQRDMQFVLWFEPERVGAPNDTWLGTNHPDWLLQPGSVGLILNEGNPAVFNWLTNHFDALIKANGVDWYREDMNGGGPCSSWRAHDPSNRQGITENFYVQNHLAYWDALLAMNPGLRIDSCASGGRRNDLETMRRAVPLTRTDFEFEYMQGVVDGNQCQTYGISSWLPFHGTGAYIYDTYSFRSFYMTLFGMGGLSSANQAAQQQAYSECRRVASFMLYGDYYPLTPYSLADTIWIAWEFDRPELSSGEVQVFRRLNSLVASLQLRLQGLEPAKTYAVEDFDKGSLGWYTGDQLMNTGLTIQLGPRQSAVLSYSPASGVNVLATASMSVAFGGMPVQFSAQGISTSGGPITYAWTFGDGDTSAEQNPQHTYNTEGNYVAEVTAADSLARTAKAQVAVTVIKPRSKMKITFPAYNRSEVLTNFPELVVFGTNLSANGFAYSQLVSTKGWDLVFMNADQTQTLNHEVEKWDTNGNSYVWVQVPQLATNACIWAYWGSSNLALAPPPWTTNGSAWGAGYAGVWHLGELSGTLPHDSTVNGVLATANTTYGTCTQGTSGEVGNGCAFSGGYLTTTAATLPAGASSRTLSTWFHKNAAATLAPGKEIVGYGNNLVPGDRFGLWLSGNGTVYALGVENQGVARSFPWAWDSRWHYLAAVLPPGQTDLSGVRLFLDGVEQTSATGSGAINTAQDELSFAAVPGYHTADQSYSFDGTLDEVRISAVARSANWVWAEWMSAASNTVFASYGPVLDNIAWPFKVLQMTLVPDNQFALVWQTTAGRLYTVESNTNLPSAGAWNPVATNLSGTNGLGGWTGQVSQATEFFRVRLQP